MTRYLAAVIALFLASPAMAESPSFNFIDSATILLTWTLVVERTSTAMVTLLAVPLRSAKTCSASPAMRIPVSISALT